MSITDGFERRAWEDLPFMNKYYESDVRQLLAHARNLEAMLRKHEWARYAAEYAEAFCPECGSPGLDGHSPDCALAKLLS